jgi:hemerythrin superfamily protein
MASVHHEASHDLNLVELLLFEHEQQRALFAELRGNDGTPGIALFRRLARMLATHEAAEEVVLYPVVRANFTEGHELAHEATKQEDAIKKALAELQAGGRGRSSLSWREGLRELEEMVRLHHDLEERHIIAVLPEVQDAPQLGGLATAYEVIARLLPTRGHRHGPTGPVGNVLLGTPIAIVDKLRDKRPDRR